MGRNIRIFDTTLRDGEQAPGCSMNLGEKIEIAKQLERLRVDVIEAGFAISSPGDFESVSEIARVIKNAGVASLARALEKDIDAAYNAIKHAENPLLHLVLSTSPLHMHHKLRMTPDEVLERTAAMVKYAAKKCPNVEFSAEDATRSDPAFLARVFSAAIANGATIINVPDTVGYAVPQEMFSLIAYLKKNVIDIEKAVISVHCHDDLGLSVANSLSAVEAGAGQVEGAINGIGERAGNTALEEFIMILNTRKELLGVSSNIDTRQIHRTSRLVYSIIGMSTPLNKAVVGANAFSHESGIHQHGVMAERTTYEIMSPEDIGLSRNKMILGKHSGRHAFEDKLKEMGYSFGQSDINRYFEQFKKLADKKKTVNDYDILAIVTNRMSQSDAHYRLSHFELNAGNKSTATCVIGLEVSGAADESGEKKQLLEVALGDGPIDAAYNAIDKLIPLPKRELEDYSIRSVSEGKDALGEVVVRLKTEDGQIYSGRGISMDILEASILAYIDGVNKLEKRGDGGK